MNTMLSKEELCEQIDQMERDLAAARAECEALRKLLGECREYIISVNVDCVRGTDNTDEERDALVDAIDEEKGGKP